MNVYLMQWRSATANPAASSLMSPALTKEAHGHDGDRGLLCVNLFCYPGFAS